MSNRPTNECRSLAEPEPPTSAHFIDRTFRRLRDVERQLDALEPTTMTAEECKRVARRSLDIAADHLNMADMTLEHTGQRRDAAADQLTMMAVAQINVAEKLVN